ncbi:hypothetical protein G7Y89_g2672 [Cudoniella acicularis]|uniref:2-hydroxyacyl-CoA lyase n=1 Tax=Cudoniella acicularis TaxID=354080 RepID=A0A8H4W6R3_9HELO|nr:hypothetical protein G7Y89_g2672 [Cudoniella acicularis]
MAPPTGAALIARALHELGIRVIFGLVGIPVVQIAEEAIALGIRFIAFRNEQAASYAATAYGYLTGKPGVCLVVGGPGVLHAMAGIGNSSGNAFPLLLLAGSSETHLVTKGAFQEMDAVSLLTPHTKIAIRSGLDSIPQSLTTAYRTSWYGRGGPSFVDLPADIIQGEGEETTAYIVPSPPKAGSDPEKIKLVIQLLKSAKAPLVIVGKGAAYAQAESVIRRLINQTKIPFLPTPMAKGVLPDSHTSNTASARSTALKGADVVLILGARLNWILHFGEEPKWNSGVKIIQVDISAEELGKNNGDPALGIIGDINVVTSQIINALEGWQYNTSSSEYVKALKESEAKNEAKAAQAAKVDKTPMTYARTFNVIKDTLHKLSPPEDGGIVYVSEGANTMDISRSVFLVEHPRLRLDAGTYATMGVGLGYAIAAHCAYNLPSPDAISGPKMSRKKIVCLEGDSAFGFSLAEVETMARYGMDVLIFVVNNGGVYHGDSEDSDEWLEMQQNTIKGKAQGGLRSSSLGWEVGYEKVAEMCGGKGFLVRTPEELAKATKEGFKASVPVVINVIIEAGQAQKLGFHGNNIIAPFPKHKSITSLPHIQNSTASSRIPTMCFLDNSKKTRYRGGDWTRPSKHSSRQYSSHYLTDPISGIKYPHKSHRNSSTKIAIRNPGGIGVYIEDPYESDGADIYDSDPDLAISSRRALVSTDSQIKILGDGLRQLKLEDAAREHKEQITAAEARGKASGKKESEEKAKADQALQAQLKATIRKEIQTIHDEKDLQEYRNLKERGGYVHQGMGSYAGTDNYNHNHNINSGYLPIPHGYAPAPTPTATLAYGALPYNPYLPPPPAPAPTPKQTREPTHHYHRVSFTNSPFSLPASSSTSGFDATPILKQLKATTYAIERTGEELERSRRSRMNNYATGIEGRQPSSVRRGNYVEIETDEF